jgi:hypothetical protein
MGFLLWVQQTGFATFVREAPSLWAYPFFLTVHAIGLAIVVGVSSVVALRLIGFATVIPVAPLGHLFPLMWAGFVANAISGASLWMADAVNKTVPGQSGQAPVFFVKLLFVILAAGCLRVLQQRFHEARTGVVEELRDGRMLAGMLLAFWFLAMTAGRLIGYAS